MSFSVIQGDNRVRRYGTYGDIVGLNVGLRDGLNVGSMVRYVGLKDGLNVGSIVRYVGLKLGLKVGLKVLRLNDI